MSCESAPIQMLRQYDRLRMVCSRSIEYLDKSGNPFTIEECNPEHVRELVDMYDAFSQKAISQGLPPHGEKERCSWIEKLMACGKNLMVRQNGRVVGHAALLPDLNRMDAEYIIFVDSAFRNRGLGSALTANAVQCAKKSGIKNVWLTVECFNFRAIRVYRKVGFQFCDEGERERTMVLLF